MARAIYAHEAGQLPRNRHVLVRNPADPTESAKRRLLIGETEGGRTLTLVIEQSIDPACVERRDGDLDATLRILVSVQGEDAASHRAARRIERQVTA